MNDDEIEDWIENVSESPTITRDGVLVVLDDDERDEAKPEPIERVWAQALAIERAIRDTKVEISAARTAEEALDAALDLALVTGSFQASPEEPADLAALADRLRSLEDGQDDLEVEMDDRGRPPEGWMPPPPRKVTIAAEPKPDDLLRRSLSDDELQHFRWLVETQLDQREVAARLGIKQAAVSKRETKLRAHVDAIYQAAFERSYPWMPIPKPQGGRRRKA